MAPQRDLRGTVRAPEFPPDTTWLNVGRPLTLRALRGKLVLLDFWTYGCINCIHVIPDLKRLEAQFPDELVVIGVHSAKFANEGEAENVRRIVLRYELEHPVAVDVDMQIWEAYAVRAWPTSVLIDPRGYLLATHSGEGVYAAYADLIAEAVRRADGEGLLDRTPLALTLEREAAPQTPLSFPGKVLASQAAGRLFVADSNHHRIVVADLDGRVQAVIGAGAPGLADGTYEEARFSRPQGMALDGEVLYVADTENHALRAVDLATRRVATLAGDGELSYSRTAPGTGAAAIRLNSPWDLWLEGRVLYIAMAGLHQIWALDLEAATIGPYAGSGREGLLDGPPAAAALAQPSGLAGDGRRLYFADSEASAVRSVGLANDPERVRTLVGEGLFAFGDVDGRPPAARLQHPLAVAAHAGVLYVADTYNHKIKRLALNTGEVASAEIVTWLGDGRPGWRDGAALRFYEPGGLSVAGERLYIADTNNHVVRVADLATGEVHTLVLRDPEGLLVRGSERRGRVPVVRLPEQRVRPGAGRVVLGIALPAGYTVNPLAASRLAWQGLPPEVALQNESGAVPVRAGELPLALPAAFAAGRGVLAVTLALYYCAAGAEGDCRLYYARLEAPLWVTPEAADADLRLDVAVALTR